MDKYETIIWVWVLWFLSLGTMAWLAIGICIGYWTSVLIVSAMFFAITFIIWLFRVTYLAGRKNR